MMDRLVETGLYHAGPWRMMWKATSRKSSRRCTPCSLEYAVRCCCRPRWWTAWARRRTQNQPGTSREYSNWRVPLAGPDLKVVHTDEVFDLPRVQSLAAIMNGEK